MPTMPNVVGLELADAQQSLRAAGVLVPTSLGYFGTWPVTALWAPSASAVNIVTAQSPTSGGIVAANSAVMLTVSEPKVGVVYP